MANKTARTKLSNSTHAATLGYEAELWRMADALRGSMDAAEYKHVVLGLIFLKYISDTFEEHRSRLQQEPYADPDDPDEYRAANVFWVPPEARWERLQQHARQPTIGELVDQAMEAVERGNPSLKGVLPKDYARPGLDKHRVGQLVDLVSNIRIGDTESRARDVLGSCKSATLEEIRRHGHVLTPGRYVGAEVKAEDDEPFEEKMRRLVAELRQQQAEATRLDEAIRWNLEELGVTL